MPLRLKLLFALFSISLALPLAAQVSPGPLSRAHHALDSPLKCASCHVFGAGAPKLRCLTCHREIRELTEQKRGYHGRVVKAGKGDTDCARCHTEHYGENFRIIRWPTSKDDFDHRETGFPLAGRHEALKCEQCHNARFIPAPRRKLIQVKDLARTFQGLSASCGGCHEDRHAGQLGADCQRCHDQSRWKPAPGFDHAKSKYPLEARHTTVPCEKCHRPLADNAKVIQYKGLQFAQCAGCHQDPHKGAFAARCEQCHTVGGWKEVRMTAGSFDHSRTKFPLLGKHEAVACQKCHKDANFKTPVAHARCLDCHQDRHKGQFARRPDGGECAPCHSANGWRPSTFTEASHRATAYPLLGKHQGVACAKCHAPAGLDTNYHPKFAVCADCHRDPHGGQFAREPLGNRCEQCHTVEGFKPSTYTLTRHQTARFALKGAHAAVVCGDCHREEPKSAGRDRVFHFASLRCEECHKDPHGGRMPTALKAGLAPETSLCEGCHTLRSWRDAKPFDHGMTGYALLGAHRTLACVDCHRPGAEVAGVRPVPFTGARKDCAGCHEDIHLGQFERAGQTADCSSCHGQARWAAAAFNHNATGFPLTGAHVNVPCRLCHDRKTHAGERTAVVYRGTPRECSSCHKNKA